MVDVGLAGLYLIVVTTQVFADGGHVLGREQVRRARLLLVTTSGNTTKAVEEDLSALSRSG